MNNLKTILESVDSDVNFKQERIWQLPALLKKIGWSMRNHGCDHYYIYNHKGECTDWCYWHDRIERKNTNDYSCCTFYIKDVDFELLEDGDAVSVAGKTNDSIFILFMNHKS